MREQLYACEESALLAYLEQLENATAAEIKLAASLFGEDDDDDDEDEVDDIYDEEDGKARIKVDGPLSMNGPSPLARLFGLSGTSYRAIMGACSRAAASACTSVAFAFNSPGGDIAGVDQVWQAISALSAKKDCVAENHGLMASAAYWLASACPKIKAMSPACEQGSIGVKIVAIDDSKAMEAMGRKRITIISKNAPNKDDDAATKAGRTALQERADAMEGVFIARVAEGRGVTSEYVAENYGRGGILISDEALRVRMIDEIQMSMKAEGSAPAVPDQSSRKIAITQGALVAHHESDGRKTMPSLKELLASNPDAKAEFDHAITEAQAAGVKSIQARVDKAKPFLALEVSTDGYTDVEVKQIAKLAIQVIAGEEEPSALSAFVRLVDMGKEQRKTIAAQAETKEAGDTPPLKLEANADLIAKAAALKIDVAAIEAAANAAHTDPVEALKGEIAMQEAAKGKTTASHVRGL
jgi:ClpP class serine protease